MCMTTLEGIQMYGHLDHLIICLLHLFVSLHQKPFIKNTLLEIIQHTGRKATEYSLFITPQTKPKLYFFL